MQCGTETGNSIMLSRCSGQEQESKKSFSSAWDGNGKSQKVFPPLRTPTGNPKKLSLCLGTEKPCIAGGKYLGTGIPAHAWARPSRQNRDKKMYTGQAVPYYGGKKTSTISTIKLLDILYLDWDSNELDEVFLALNNIFFCISWTGSFRFTLIVDKIWNICIFVKY